MCDFFTSWENFMFFVRNMLVRACSQPWLPWLVLPCANLEEELTVPEDLPL